MSLKSWLENFVSEEPVSFKGMNKQQKKNFLSNDLIERIIRVEQRVASHVGKPVHYKSTKYYQNLSDHEKKIFDTHLKHKHKKKFLFSLVSLIISVALAFFGIKIFIALINFGLTPLRISLFLLDIILLISLAILLYERKNRHKSLSNIHHMIGKTFFKR